MSVLPPALLRGLWKLASRDSPRARISSEWLCRADPLPTRSGCREVFTRCPLAFLTDVGPPHQSLGLAWLRWPSAPPLPGPFRASASGLPSSWLLKPETWRHPSFLSSPEPPHRPPSQLVHKPPWDTLMCIPSTVTGLGSAPAPGASTASNRGRALFLLLSVVCLPQEEVGAGKAGLC